MEWVITSNRISWNVITYACLIPDNPRGSFYKHGLTLIPAWISNYIYYNVWYEITYPFLNFNSATVQV